MQQISTKIWLPIVITVSVVFGLAIFYNWPKEKEPSEIVIPQKEIPEIEIPADWKTYRNEEYGFEFRYPPELKIKVVDSVITFRPKEEEKSEELGGYLQPPILVVSIDKNPDRLSAKEYYDGSPGGDIFDLNPEPYASMLDQVEIIEIRGREIYVICPVITFGGECTLIVPFKNHFLRFKTLAGYSDLEKLIIQTLRTVESF